MTENLEELIKRNKKKIKKLGWEVRYPKKETDDKNSAHFYKKREYGKNNKLKIESHFHLSFSYQENKPFFSYSYIIQNPFSVISKYSEEISLAGKKERIIDELLIKTLTKVVNIMKQYSRIKKGEYPTNTFINNMVKRIKTKEKRIKQKEEELVGKIKREMRFIKKLYLWKEKHKNH